MFVPFQGRQIEVKEVEALTEKELWNEYQLANGKVLLLKICLVRALEAVTEKTPDGNPAYVINTELLVKVRG